MTQHFRVIEDLGVPMTTQKITPGNTATGIGAGVYQYVERTLAFTLGGTYVVLPGDVIVGATSGAYATVVSVGTITGAWASDTAAGNLTIKGQVGTFGAAEIMKVGADATVATITGNSTAVATDYRFKNALAVAAMITCETCDQRFTLDGTTPDQTSNIGHVLPAGGSYIIQNQEAIQRFKTIDKTSGSAGTLRVTCLF